MAGLDDLLDELEETASCSICIAFINQPKTLPCGHSFCAQCIEGWLGSQPQSNANGSKELRCPECNGISTLSTEGINGLPTNVRINQILSVIQAHMEKKDARPVASPITRGSHLSLRQRNEGIYGSWRPNFLKHCKGELDRATNICQAKLGELEQLEQDNSKKTVNFEVSLEMTKREIKTRADEFFKKIRDAETHLLDEVESMGHIGTQQYQEEKTLLQSAKHRYVDKIQNIQNWLELPDRNLLKNYQENCGDLEDLQREPPLNLTRPGGGSLVLQLHAPHIPDTLVEMFGTITKQESNLDSYSTLPNAPSFPFANANLAHGSNLGELTFESLNQSALMQSGHRGSYRTAVEGNERPPLPPAPRVPAPRVPAPPVPAPRVPAPRVPGRSASNLSLNVPSVHDIRRFPSEPVYVPSVHDIRRFPSEPALNTSTGFFRKHRNSKGCTVM